MDVHVIRSAKRRRTSAARFVDGRIEVRIPSWFDAELERTTVQSLVARLTRQRTADDIDLHDRARTLADRYGLPRPHLIEWATNQRSRWGSCNATTGHIRVSDRLAGFPSWVVDGVIVHELAHLAEANHSPAFWELVARYPKAERAMGFLIAKGMAEDEEDE